MARTDPQVSLRLPVDIRDRIRERAAASRRSINAEIVHCLECVLGAQDEKGPAEVAASPSHVTANPCEEIR